ncbi:MAG: MBOAT family protein [Crocinitomicaceae bacterium]|jgi:alginate O-acetyltransferase complex protein AlgI|nr:MBOAT family protein [Crocinitomicaceae bacterium]
MFFNSLDFALFLPIVFICYWFLTAKNLKLQNCLLIVSSYVFYGWWDYRFLLLILFSTIVDYSVGIFLNRQSNTRNRKLLLWTSIFVNLGLLGFFKYCNFFIHNFVKAFSFFGVELEESTLAIILPVGISFYTFQTLSYTIDVYRKKLKPTTDFIAFTAFVSFFPQLVAGPIERATNLLPQFYQNRKFNYSNAVDGLRQILWGLFKKMVIADGCAEYANLIFNNASDYSGSTLILGALFFTFQIYGDFSGYSDIAIGTSRLFGFNLMQNFAFPYFSRDIAEFWRRWHISLSTWFRDYVYIPLGGSRGSVKIKIRNIFIIFIVSGFWHGANWTFIAWGALNAIYFLPLLLLKHNRKNMDIVAKGSYFPSLKAALQIVFTFSLTVVAWVFFRAENISRAWSYLTNMFSHNIVSIPDVIPWPTVFVLLFFIGIEWLGRDNQYALEKFAFKASRIIRWMFYLLLVILIFLSNGKEQAFIYFQF